MFLGRDHQPSDKPPNALGQAGRAIVSVMILAAAFMMGEVSNPLGLPDVHFTVAVMLGTLLSQIGVTPSCASCMGIYQAVIGVSLGQLINISTETYDVMSLLPVALFALLLVFVAALLSALILHRVGRIQIGTSILGMLPGASSSILAIASTMNVDMRLVTLLQHIRIYSIIGILFWIAEPILHIPQPAVAADTSLLTSYAGLVSMVVFGVSMGDRLVPAGSMLLPFTLSVFAELSGLPLAAVPEPIFNVCMAGLDLSIGFTVNWTALRDVQSRLYPILFSTALLIILCTVSALPLIYYCNLSTTTAFLSTLPVGITYVGAVATSTGANLRNRSAGLLLSRLFAGREIDELCTPY